MKFVDLRKSFVEKNGKYEVSYNTYSNIGMYVVSNEYHNSEYGEDLRVSVAISTEEGVVSDLDVQVDIINVKRTSKRRELIAFEVKYNYIVSYIEKLKSIHNILDIEFIKDVVDFILNCDDFSNVKKYEVVIEDTDDTEDEADVVEANVDEANVDEADVVEAKVVEEEIKVNRANKNFNKSFEVNRDGLLKSYSITTEEVESQYGYTDLLCRFEAISTILVDDKYVSIKANIEVCDGVVISYHVYQSRIHKQLESFLDSMTTNNISKVVNELVEDIMYEANSYIGEKGYDFAYSLMTMILNLDSYNSDTYLYNNITYSLANIA